MRKKQIMLVALTSMLVLPSFVVEAAPNNRTTEKVDGELLTKDEVVYATLNANGELNEIYVVNMLDVTKAGTIIDYGTYSSLKNLTDLSELEQGDQQVQIEAPKGKFYYQGNMDSGELPWDVTISYVLDGKEMDPDVLAGKDGQLSIHIHTFANEKVDPVFFETYLLQISLTFDPDLYSNIEISEGLMVNVGKNKQVTFTVMPEQEGELSLTAGVVDFELEGIDISAVPSSMSIDAPDIDEMSGEMESLTDAIEEVNKGVGQLKSGIFELNNGVTSLRNGSEQYKNGMSNINRASAELIQASGSIDEALATISNSLSDSEEFDLSQLHDLPEGLRKMANGLNETANGLAILRENYNVAYSSLDDAMEAIPSYSITEEDIHGLYASGANASVVDKLVETYSAAQVAKGTYSGVKQGFSAVDTTLKEINGSIREMGGALSSIANGLSSSLEGMDDMGSLTQLQEGLATLSSNYGEFHSGLVDYTNGVGQLSISYNELHSGIVELSGGTNELAGGATELHNGTGTLAKSTSKLPDQMQEEIDRMIAEYDKSDFDPVSFVSSNNEQISTVQFVIKTESIKKEEQETNELQVVEEKGFWKRLLDLFS
ncbi:YhgE/Pip domain-containing protein [Halalkalibacter alkalisediminis]|uniref:YhgE/Pip domain-containing protein n=1 Tax=Halalkalibacter alkalisediminis TaxID=935616 RepID=A0ABV6NIQ4_9BACI|nr:YhgE/Pip domain-containing protein [Halalkalibacter alkalisediminis]